MAESQTFVKTAILTQRGAPHSRPKFRFAALAIACPSVSLPSAKTPVFASASNPVQRRRPTRFKGGMDATNRAGKTGSTFPR